EPAARHAHLLRRARDLGVERLGHARPGAPHGVIPRGRPRAPARQLEHPRAIGLTLGLACRGRASLPPQFEGASRELLPNVVERDPWIEQPSRDNDAPQRRRELGNAQGHQQLHRVHSRRLSLLTRATRPVRFSYASVKYGSDSGRNASRGIPVAGIARSIASGDPSTSRSTSIDGYHSSRSVASPSRYCSIARSTRTATL